MCGYDGAEVGSRPVLTRRALLAGAAAAAGAAVVPGWRVPAGARRSVDAVDLGGVAVLPRQAWAGGLAPAGPLPAEPDVRYLLVHHSVDPGNAYAEGDVAGILRQFFRFHTSPAKGWPDIAYNFLVDRFGRVWEGRAGSLVGPVAGDATGGNQGFDQLCCFVGDHQEGQPTGEAFAAMGRLLGALAGRYGVSVAPDATATFTSRGSDRHPAGAVVTTATVAGHRDMSRTRCPGDLVVARLPELRLLAAARTPSAAAAPPPPAPAATGPGTAADAVTAATGAPPAPAETATSTAAAGSGTPTAPGPRHAVADPPRTTTSALAVPAAAPSGDGSLGVPVAIAVAAALGAAAATGAVARGRRPHSLAPGDDSRHSPPPGG